MRRNTHPITMAATTTPASTSTSPDFSHRLDPALVSELMDEPCSYADFRDCVRDIASTTWITRAYTPTLRFVQQALATHTGDRPLHIVDVGSGGGDMLRRIARWAHRHNHAVQLTGIDLNPHATRAANELSASHRFAQGTDWRTGDIFTDPATQIPDLVLSSLVTHHMRDEEIIRFLRWMEAHATRGWFISDLIRSPRAYRLFSILSRFMRWHHFVRLDGLVSIRRGFREPDWQRLLAAAGIPIDQVRLYRAGIGRLCLARSR